MRANSQRKSVAESASKSKGGHKVGGGIGGAESRQKWGVDDDKQTVCCYAFLRPP